MVKNDKWHIQEVCPSKNLIDFTGDELLAKLLTSRGISTAEQAKVFLNPLEGKISEANVFTDIDKAVERIKKAVKGSEHILIWGDFDADGVTSTALLFKTFTAIGANFSHFIPEREAHGHGLNSKVLMNLVSKQKVKVVITVDCGVSNTKEVSLLKGLGVDTIITDHHKAPEDLPEAYAILNPRAENSLKQDLSVAEIKSLSDLAGAGVAHKFATSLLKEFKIKNNELKNELLALATIGTISDVVPLLGENRTIVTKGLKCINDGALKGVSELFKSCSRGENISSTDIAFVLSPRINAVGRLSKADEAFNLLTSDNTGKISISIEHLNNNNKIRQSLCDEIFNSALLMTTKEITKEKAIVLFNPDWHIGIIGIVASRLVETYNKPVFLGTTDAEGTGRVSVRGVNGYNIYEILKENETLFAGYGGHTLAGGFSFDIKAHPFDEVKSAILSTFNELPESKTGNLLEIDAEINANDLNKGLLETLAKLEPFGQMNSSPIFCIRDAVLASYNFIGKENSHLKYICQKDGRELTCVWWGKSSFDIPKGTMLDIAFSPRLNAFNGMETIQLVTCDIASEHLANETVNKTESSRIKFYDHRHKTDILPQINGYLSDPKINLRVIALKSVTIEALKPFPSIFERIGLEEKCDALMFFDYPPTKEELDYILIKSDANKVHLMPEAFNDDFEYYIKKLSGMLKFVANKKEGVLDLPKAVQELSLSENFVAMAIDLFEKTGCIRLIEKNRIAYLKPVAFEELIQSAECEKLTDEFEKIMNLKGQILLSNDFESLFNPVSAVSC